jgi:recombination protein RecT
MQQSEGGRIMTDIKQELVKKVEKQEVKITKSMSIADMIKALEPEIKKALPSVITPERFTRMALSALNTTPKLSECTRMSFLGALMNAAQLGLEPNTPLGQAYLIPYNNKGKLECQFQIGYKGMIDLVYRNEQVQSIQAHCVYENDYFDYELGLNSRLVHKPALKDRGEMVLVYALFKLENNGFAFEVMSKEDIDTHAKKYSKGFSSSYSPWNSNYFEMCRKTVVKKLLRYAPLKTDFLRAVETDESIKSVIAPDMSELRSEIQDDLVDGEYMEVDEDAGSNTNDKK